jgi:hypothetical protein
VRRYGGLVPCWHAEPTVWRCQGMASYCLLHRTPCCVLQKASTERSVTTFLRSLFAMSVPSRPLRLRDPIAVVDPHRALLLSIALLSQ